MKDDDILTLTDLWPYKTSLAIFLLVVFIFTFIITKNKKNGKQIWNLISIACAITICLFFQFYKYNFPNIINKIANVIPNYANGWMQSAFIGFLTLILLKLIGGNKVSKSLTSKGIFIIGKAGLGPISLILRFFPSFFILWLVIIILRVIGSLNMYSDLSDTIKNKSYSINPNNFGNIAKIRISTDNQIYSWLLDKVDPFSPRERHRLILLSILADQDKLLRNLAIKNKTFYKIFKSNEIANFVNSNYPKNYLKNKQFWKLLGDKKLAKIAQNHKKNLRKLNFEKNLILNKD